MQETNHESRQRGSAGITALLVMMLLLTIGGAMLTISSNEVRAAANYRDGIAAQYAAEAGAKRAMVELNKNNGQWSSSITGQIGNGSYTVSMEKQGLNRILTSIGTVNNAKRQVVLSITPETVFDYALFSDKNMVLGVNSINGSVGSNQDITLTAFTRAQGDVIAHGNIYNLTRLNTVGGKIIEGAPIMPLPSFNRDMYKNIGKVPNIEHIILLGDFWTGPSKLNNEVYYYDGDLKLWINSIQGPGIIYATGNVNIGFAMLSDNIIVISEKNITVPIGSAINKAALVAGGDIEISVSAFNGSAVARGTITVPVDLVAHPGSNSGWNVTKNPYLPEPPAWISDRIKVDYWNNQKIQN